MATNQTHPLGISYPPHPKIKNMKQGPPRNYGETLYARAILEDDMVLIAGSNRTVLYPWQGWLKNSEGNNLEKYYTSDRLIKPRERHYIIKTADGRILIMGGRCYEYIDGTTVKRAGGCSLVEEFTYPEKNF